MRVRDVTCDMLLQMAEENRWPVDFLFMLMAGCPAWDAPWDEELFKATVRSHDDALRRHLELRDRSEHF